MSVGELHDEAKRQQDIGKAVEFARDAGIDITKGDDAPIYETVVKSVTEEIGIPKEKDDHITVSNLKEEVVGNSTMLHGITEDAAFLDKELNKQKAIESIVHQENLMDIAMMEGFNSSFTHSTMGSKGYRSEQLVQIISAITNTDKALKEALNGRDEGNFISRALRRAVRGER